MRAAENPRTKPAFEGAQELFIDLASTLSWREFNQALRYWVLAADPDGEEPEEQIRTRRCVSRKRYDGSVEGNFRLDPLGGQTVLSALEQEEQRLFRADAESGAKRTPAQRRADALVNLLARGAARPDGSVPAPLLHLVAGTGVIVDGLRRLDPDTSPSCDPFRLPLDHERLEGRCELVDGTPLHPRFAMASLAIAGIARLVLDGDSRIIDLGRTTRSFRATSRKRHSPQPVAVARPKAVPHHSAGSRPIT